MSRCRSPAVSAAPVLAHAMFDLPLIQFSTHARTGGAQWLSEGVATFGARLHDPQHAARASRSGAAGRRAGDHRRLLVHRLDLLRQPGGDHRPLAHRQLLRHRAARRAPPSSQRSLAERWSAGSPRLLWRRQLARIDNVCSPDQRGSGAVAPHGLLIKLGELAMNGGRRPVWQRLNDPPFLGSSRGPIINIVFVGLPHGIAPLSHHVRWWRQDEQSHMLAVRGFDRC